MKYFVISDIHSHYEEMMCVLNESGFELENENHIIISCGDVWDRGSKPVEVMVFLLDLYDKNRAILIRGNHEDLLQSLLNRGYLGTYDIHNGTFETIYHLAWYCTKQKRSKTDVRNDLDYLCSIISKNKTIKRFLNAMVDYYELGDYVFTHGFIPIGYCYGYPTFNPKWKESKASEWEKARFYNGIELCSEYNIKIPNKTIVVGHYHCSYGNVRLEHGFNIDNQEAYEKYEFSDIKYFKPYYNDGIIAIDSCVYETKKINCLVLDIE